MKSHILSSSEPVMQWHMIVSLCGLEISPATMTFAWDEQKMGGPILLNSLQTCGRCAERLFVESLATKDTKEKKWVYGVQSEKKR